MNVAVRWASNYFVRFRFLVKNRLQFKFLFLTVGGVGLSVLIVLIEYYYHFRRSSGFNVFEPDVLWLFLSTNKLLFVKLGFLFTVITLAMLGLSHRLAGPLFRLEKAMRTVAEGDLSSRVKNRRRDELIELKEGFNEMVDGLRRRLEKDRQLISQSQDEINSLLSRNDLPTDVRNKLVELHQLVNKISDGFQL